MTEPAFPTAETDRMHYVPGLTKREYAAIHIAAIMPMPSVYVGEKQTAESFAEFAARAVALADAVLKEAAQ